MVNNGEIKPPAPKQLFKDFVAEVGRDPDSLELLHGRRMSAAQWKSAQELFGVKTARNSSADYVAALKSYETARGHLTEAFGVDDAVVDEYERLVQDGWLWGPTIAVDDAKAALLQPHRGQGSLTSELLELERGKRLTESQYRALERVFDDGTQLVRNGDALKDHVLVFEDQGNFTLRRTSSETYASGAAELAAKLKPTDRVIAEFPSLYSARNAETLAKAGVIWARDWSDFLRSPAMASGKIQPIFIGSTDGTLAVQLFGGQSPEKAMAAAKKFGDKFGTQFVVSDLAAYNTLASDLRAKGAVPFPVYHVEADGSIFGGAAYARDIDPGLGCSTFRFDTRFHSTIDIDIDMTIDSLAKIHGDSKWQSNHSAEDFMADFAAEYQRARRANGSRVAPVIVIGVVGFAAIVVLEYLSSCDPNKDPSCKNP